MEVSCIKNAIFPGVHKIGATVSGPRIADKNYMDARIFLIVASELQKDHINTSDADYLQQEAATT